VIFRRKRVRKPTTPTSQGIALSIECENAIKSMRERHQQEEEDLRKHYRNLIHSIVFPKRKR